MSMKRLGSVTTTNPKARSLPTSAEDTGSGAVIALSTEMRQLAAARLLEVADPAEVDKRLVCSLESISNSKVIEHTRTRFTDTEAIFSIQKYEINCTTVEQCDKCEYAILKSMATMSVDEITDQLTLLAALVVKPTGESVKDYSFRMKAIGNQLAEYPADIVVQAIKAVSKTSTFWPSYAEFYKHIEWRITKRNLLLKAIRLQREALLKKGE